MIDPATGEMRPEFANNPETAEYARWAKDEYDKANVDRRIDRANEIEDNPNLTRTEKDAQHRDNFEGMDQTDFEGLLRDQDTDQAAVAVARTELDDRADLAIQSVDAGTSIAGF